MNCWKACIYIIDFVTRFQVNCALIFHFFNHKLFTNYLNLFPRLFSHQLFYQCYSSWRTLSWRLLACNNVDWLLYVRFKVAILGSFFTTLLGTWFPSLTLCLLFSASHISLILGLLLPFGGEKSPTASWKKVHRGTKVLRGHISENVCFLLIYLLVYVCPENSPYDCL